MKKQLAVFLISIAFICANALANDHHGPPHKAKAHAGDTVFPGSQEWLHAGSPHDSKTGDPIALIWGTDGQLHSLGYAIEDSGGAWVASTPENRKIVEEHLETKRLIAAVKEIMRESPDRKIVRPAKARNLSVTLRDTGYDPYKYVMHWADSIGRVFDDPDFFQGMEQYYRQPKNGLWLTPWYEPSRD